MKANVNGWVKVFGPLVLLILLSGATFAQSVASISGRVADSSGAVIGAAKVTVRDTDTGETREATTDTAGFYRVLSLPVGNYQVRIEKEGFKTEVRSGIQLVVGQEAVINVSMEIGGLAQQVTVTGEAPVVNTTTEATSGLVGEQAVKDLPLNGRSFDELVTLNSGTVNFTSMHTTSSPVSGGIGNLFSIGGRRLDENLFLLNGVEYGGNGLQADSPGSVSGLLLGVDAVREFNLLSDNYPAEYGKKAGGQVSIVTMSGTNQLHGTLFEFLRNNDLDARNFFDYGYLSGGPRNPHFERNNFGGSLGGPIRKDKTFIFGNYEGFRQILGLSNVAIVPDLNARKGIINGQNVGVAPGVAPYLAIYPLPNGPELGDGAAEYFNSPPETIREDFGTTRFDQIFSSKDSFNAVYTIDDGVSLTPQLTDTFVTTFDYRAQVLSLTEVHVFSPTLLNTFISGFSRSNYQYHDVPIITIPANISFAQGDELGQISIGGGAGGSSGGTLTQIGAGNPTRSARNLFTETDNLQIVKGIHLINVGVWFQRVQDNSDESLNIGKASFNTLTNLLEGQLASFQGTPYADPLGFRSLEGAWYVQDTIKVRSNLTLNAGLRHEFTNGWNEADCRMSTYVLGPSGVLLNQPVIGCGLFTTNHALFLFGPRLGIAWDPFGDGKTAVHAGFGMYYNLMDDLAFTTEHPPFDTSVTITGGTFPFTQITPTNASTIPGAVPMGGGPPPNTKTPTEVAYNLKIDRGLGANLALSVGYSGSHGYHNFAQVDVNTVYPLVCGAAVQPYPVPAGATCPVPAGTQGQTAYYPNGLPAGTLYYAYKGAARRNPAFGSSRLFESRGDSNYNALTVELTERLKYGLSFKTNYTWSRALDDSSSTTVFTNAASSVLNPENLAQDYAPSMFNITNRFSFSGSYQLPFGKGKALWSNAGEAADRIVGGWQLNTIITAQSGLPLNPQLGTEQSDNGNTNEPDRPSINPNFSGPLYLNNPNEWINPAAYINPVVGTYGNAGRNSLLCPGLFEVDLSAFKTIPLNERFNLQFRAEAFNVFNRVNFGAPNNLILNPNGTARRTAGQITTTATTSREVQLALKLIW